MSHFFRTPPLANVGDYLVYGLVIFGGLMTIIIGFVLLKFFTTWFRAKLANAPVSWASLIGMFFRKVPYGMITDSRSFLSYTRHEYFRRILANLLGAEIEQGLLPPDFDLIGGLVQDICYNNAAGYFGLDLGDG